MGKKLSSILNPDANEYPIRAFATIGHTHDDYPVSYATTAARDAITDSERYEGVIAYVIADQTTYQLRGGTENTDWVPLVTALGGTSHTLLADIGTNTHAAIDTHIADATLHYAQAAISITESQISDLRSYSVSTHVHPIGSITGFTDNSTNWDTAFGWGDHSVAGYISGYTVTEGDVTGHQAALSITESQISDLQTYSVSTHNHDGSYIIPTDGVANRIPVFTAAAAAIGTSIFTWDGDIFTADKFILNNTLDRLTIGDGTVAVPGLEINATAAGDPYINLQQDGVTSTILKFDDASARTELSSLADDITLRPGNVDTLTLTGALLTMVGNFTAVDITATGAFTSLGIDDNATGERLQIADGALVVGANDVASFGMARASNTGIFTMSGGNATFAGADLVLYSGAHSTNAGDFFLRSVTDTIINWDSSAGTLVFESGTTPATALTLDASQNATFAGDVSCAGFTSTGIDDNCTSTRITLASTGSAVVFNGNPVVINHEDTDAYVQLSGGNSGSDGANMLMYGSTQSGNASDFRVRIGTADMIEFDYSVGDLEFSTGAAGSLTAALTIDASQNAIFAGDVTVTGAFASTGIDDNAAVETLQLTDTNMQLGTAAGSAFNIVQTSNDQYLAISGGTGVATGANIFLYGGSHATAGDFIIRNDANTWLTWDETAGSLVIGTGSGTKTTALTLDSSQNATFAGTVTTQAGIIINTTRVTTTYQILVTDTAILANTDAGTYTATLPAGAQGQSLRIVNTGTAGILLTVAPSGAELLLGVNSNFTLFDGESIELVYDTTDGWY